MLHSNTAVVIIFFKTFFWYIGIYFLIIINNFKYDINYFIKGDVCESHTQSNDTILYSRGVLIFLRRFLNNQLFLIACWNSLNGFCS